MKQYFWMVSWLYCCFVVHAMKNDSLSCAELKRRFRRQHNNNKIVFPGRANCKYSIVVIL